MSREPTVVPEPPRLTRRLAGFFLVLPVIQYWISEYVTAAAWKNPRYLYTYNFVSDLGVTDIGGEFDGRLVTSPLHALMNGSFTALGSLVVIASALLFLSMAGYRNRYLMLSLGAVFAVGSWLVGGFPENTVPPAHIVGAFFNIVGGNVLAILLGATGAYLGFRRLLQRALIALGVLGLVATTFLVAVPGFSDGAVERVSAYSYMIAFLAAGIALTTNHRASVEPRVALCT